MVDDDDSDESPSPEPRTDSASGLPMKNRRWRQLRIVKRDETSSLIFSRKIGIYSAGIRVCEANAVMEVMEDAVQGRRTMRYGVEVSWALPL